MLTETGRERNPTVQRKLHWKFTNKVNIWNKHLMRLIKGISIKWKVIPPSRWSGFSDGQGTGVIGLVYGVKSYCHVHESYFLKKRECKGQQPIRGKSSLPDFSTIQLLMAWCHRTMCQWWAWGCQQQEAGTTLSLARQLQTSCCYTSSLAQHFISKDTQEGATHSDVRSVRRRRGRGCLIKWDLICTTGKQKNPLSLLILLQSKLTLIYPIMSS